MYFQHSPLIWDRFPGLVPGLILAGRLPQAARPDQIIDSLTRQARQRLQQNPESQMPQILAWRKAYSQMGLKPTKYRCAAEALLRRFRREDILPRLHPLVDLANAVSLAYAVPVAVIDLARIRGHLEVRPAQGSEEYLAFSGQVENPDPGEIIFVDGAGQVHSRRWTFRQSSLSTIIDSTAEALIISEALHDGAIEDMTALMDSITTGLEAMQASVMDRIVLSAGRPRWEMKQSTGI